MPKPPPLAATPYAYRPSYRVIAPEERTATPWACPLGLGVHEVDSFGISSGSFKADVGLVRPAFAQPPSNAVTFLESNAGLRAYAQLAPEDVSRVDLNAV